MNLITQKLSLPERYDLSPDAKAQRGQLIARSQSVEQEQLDAWRAEQGVEKEAA